MRRRRRIVIIQKSIPAYRVPFYLLLRRELEARGIQLTLVCGDSVGDDKFKADRGQVDWAHYRPHRHLRVGRRELIWQPVLDLAEGADLVIVEQASKLLVNYVFLALQSRSTSPAVALWGHGANLQRHTASRIGEAIKVLASRRARWWFAYTESTRQLLITRGIPNSRITVVQNSTDTVALRRDMADIADHELRSCRAVWQSTPGRTAVFIGGLYAEKRLRFMVQACAIAAEHLPHFRLLIAGDGPDRAVAEELAKAHGFVMFLGRVDGREKAALLQIADCIVMPGLVGLAIVDSFAAEAPLITTSVPYHSPEIDYLEDGVNGILVRDPYSPSEFGKAVRDVMTDELLIAGLRTGCRIAAERYTNEEMVRRFADGVELALEATGSDSESGRHRLNRPGFPGGSKPWKGGSSLDRVDFG
jgi:glycosyltransferase involved in cell wall biosynthesis